MSGLEDRLEEINETIKADPNIIPDDVKDPIAYKQYLRFSSSPILSIETRRIETSDGDVIIDPAANIRENELKIAHLPIEEREFILKRCKGFQLLYHKIYNLKLKAFGVRSNKGNPVYIDILAERSSEVIEMMGRLLTDYEISKIIFQDWGFKIPLHKIAAFRVDNKNSIISLNDDYIRNYNDIRLSHKKGRLEEYLEIYNKQKEIWLNSPTPQNTVILTQILKNIRDEVEDPKLKIEHNISHSIDITVGYHIQQEIMKGMTITDIVIARAAARLRVNTAFLLERLHTSVYNKNSGFERPDGDIEDQDVPFASNIVYNWNDIARKHAEGAKEPLTEFEELPPEEVPMLLDAKQLLIEKLKQKKIDLSMSEQKIKDIDKGNVKN